MLPPSPPVESGCTVLRYSYLADPITYLTVSISNEYTGDATTSGLGNSYLEITFTGDTTVAQTDSLPSEGQELNRGDCIITVYLRKPKSSIPLPLRRKSEPGAKVHGHTMLRTCLHCVLPCFFYWLTRASSHYVQLRPSQDKCQILRGRGLFRTLVFT